MATTQGFLEERLSKNQYVAYVRYKQQVWRTVRAILSERSAVVGTLIVAFFTILAVFAPLLAPYNPDATFIGPDGQAMTLRPPSLAHPFGTTHLGRDVFSQWIFGSRVSIVVGLISGLSVMFIGSTVGLIAGYYKGTVDLVLMRIVDILYGIPAIPLILVVALFYGASFWTIIIAMVVVLWRTMARVIRAQTLSLSERPFVKAARARGASDLRIIYLHIAPNLLPLMLIETTFVISGAITLEAAVSFLGAGTQNMVSWGTMLQLTFATGAIREAWWWVLPPGISITLLVISFFYISRSIENITNPEIGGQIK